MTHIQLVIPDFVVHIPRQIIFSAVILTLLSLLVPDTSYCLKTSWLETPLYVFLICPSRVSEGDKRHVGFKTQDYILSGYRKLTQLVRVR